MILRMLVRPLVLRAFRDLSAGRIDRHIGRFAETAVLRVHAPEGGGTFQGRRRIAAGLEQLYRTVPHHAFRVDDIWVHGHPGLLRIAVHWQDDALGSDRRPTPRTGMNRILIHRGRVAEEEVFIAPARPD